MSEDPGISTKIHSTTADSHVDTTDFRTLKSALHAVAKHGRWNGGKPDTWSAHRTAGVRGISRALRSNEPPIERCFNGEMLVAKFREGTLYPYPLEHRKVDVGGELRPGEALPKGARPRWRSIHTRALAIVVTAHLVCKTEGLVIRQRDFAQLLGVCRDTANTVLQQLAEWGHVHAHPRAKQVELEHGGRAHHRLANRYTVTDLAVAYWSIAPRKGRKSSRAPKSEMSTAKASLPTGSDSGTARPMPPEKVGPERVTAAAVTQVVPERAQVPRETPVRLEAANRVKTRPAAPSGLYDGDGDDRPVVAYDEQRALLDELVGLLGPTLGAMVERKGGAS